MSVRRIPDNPYFPCLFTECWLNLSQNTVHDPVYAGSADRVCGARSLLLQMAYHLFDKGHLYVRWVLYQYFLSALCIVQDDGVVGKDREAELSMVANQLYSVLSGAFVTDEAPGAAPRQSVVELEACAHGVFRLIESFPVCTVTLGLYDGTEYFLKQVYLMWSQVVEVASTSNVALHSPWEVGAVVVKIAWWHGKAYLHIDDPSDGSLLYQLFYLHEIR